MQIPGKLVIRTHAPVRRWLMLLTWVLFTALGLYLVFELGRYKAGFDGIDAAKQRAVLEDQISALIKAQRDLRVQLAAANETQVAQAQERDERALVFRNENRGLQGHVEGRSNLTVVELVTSAFGRSMVR